MEFFSYTRCTNGFQIAEKTLKSRAHLPRAMLLQTGTRHKIRHLFTEEGNQVMNFKQINSVTRSASGKRISKTETVNRNVSGSFQVYLIRFNKNTSSELILQQWNLFWKTQPSNKLLSIKQIPSPWSSSTRDSKREMSFLLI